MLVPVESVTDLSGVRTLEERPPISALLKEHT
jgi:hypothetical protein